MTQISNTFEGGSDETTITTGNSGGDSGTVFSAVSIGAVGGEVKFDTAQAAHGNYGARIDAGTNSGQSSYVAWDDSAFGDPSTHYGRMYMYMGTLQGGARSILARFDGLVFLEMTSAGKFRVRDNTGFGSDSTSTISTGKWVRFEWKLVHSATVGEFTVRYFDTADSASYDDEVSITSGDTGTSPNYARIGLSLADQDQVVWVDDLIAGATDWPGPAVDPFVAAFAGVGTVTAALTNTSTGFGVDTTVATQGTTSHTDAQTSWSWSHTCSGADRVLIVSVGRAVTNQTAGDVTYNSTNMEFIAAQNGGGNSYNELWGLVNPDTGSNLVEVTYAASYNDSAHSSISFFGASGWATDNIALSDGVSDYPNTTVAGTASGNIVYGVGVYANADTQTTVTPDSGITETHDYDSGSSGSDVLCFGGWVASSGGSKVMGFTSDASISSGWVVTAIEVEAATGNINLTATTTGTSTFTAELDNTGTLSYTATPDADGTASASVINEVGTTTNLYQSIDDDPDTPTTTDYITTVASDGYAFFDLTATPAGFGAMTALFIKADIRKVLTDDTVAVYVQAFGSDETTEYSTETLLADQDSTEGLHQVQLTLNTAGLAASPTDWDGALIRFRWDTGGASL